MSGRVDAATLPAVRVPLTQGYAALVDASDAAAVNAHKWYARRSGPLVYAQRSLPRRGAPQRAQQLHTFLTGWDLVDHINGNPLDNRRGNLRRATLAQNARNARLRSDNTSGFRGVSRVDVGRWTAHIRVDRKLTHLGSFSSPEDAAFAYDSAARALHGHFAALNFPGPGEVSAMRTEFTRKEAR